MKTFVVYLKDRPNDPVLVKAEAYVTKGNWLVFMKGEEAVGNFNLKEIQGWKEQGK